MSERGVSDFPLVGFLGVNRPIPDISVLQGLPDGGTGAGAMVTLDVFCLPAVECSVPQLNFYGPTPTLGIMFAVG